MENKEKIGFGLIQISTQQFAIIPDAFDEKNADTLIDTDLRFGSNPDQMNVAPLIKVTFKQDKGPFLILEIGCFFGFTPEDWNKIYNIETKEIRIPMPVARHFVMLTIGTIRGVLHAKTENTKFSKFFLPTINVNDLVKEDVIIKASNSIE